MRRCAFLSHAIGTIEEGFTKLTKREKQVVEMMCKKNYYQRRMATELNFTVLTIKRCVSDLYDKLYKWYSDNLPALLEYERKELEKDPR
jgi:DNA-binding NarL/FixJ family response regulator